jgi:hypothetical protein
MATCALLGQAAGCAAALARRHGCDPGALAPGHLAELQQALMHDDVWLPGRARGIDPLSRTATCSAPTLLDGHDRPLGNDEHAWRGACGEAITFAWSGARHLGGLRLVCDSKLADSKRMPKHHPAALHLPTTLLRSARIEIDRGDGAWRCVQRLDDNRQRLLTLPLDCEASALRIVPEATWGGGSEVRLFAAEAFHELPARQLPQPQRPSWRERIATIDPADLQPPANQGDGRRVGISA